MFGVCLCLNLEHNEVFLGEYSLKHFCIVDRSHNRNYVSVYSLKLKWLSWISTPVADFNRQFRLNSLGAPALWRFSLPRHEGHGDKPLKNSINSGSPWFSRIVRDLVLIKTQVLGSISCLRAEVLSKNTQKWAEKEFRISKIFQRTVSYWSIFFKQISSPAALVASDLTRQ